MNQEYTPPTIDESELLLEGGPADVARTRRKLSFDLYYLKHRSFGLDLAIATKTIRALLSFSGT